MSSGNGAELPPLKAKALQDFVGHIQECEAIIYVGIRKSDPDAKASEFCLGGYQTPGPSLADLANGLGVAAAELAQGVVDGAKMKGKSLPFDKAVAAVVACIEASAKKGAPKDGGGGKQGIRGSGPLGPLGLN